MNEQDIVHDPIIDAGFTRDLTDYSEAEIAMAESRRPIVEAILVKKHRKKTDVEKAAKLIGISGRQLYSIMGAYNKDPCVGSLIGAKRGRKRGSRTLDDAVETIISDAIETKYKSLERKSIQYVAKHVNAICNRKGLPQPALNTIKARIAAIDDRELDYAREGYKVARDRHSSINEGFPIPQYVLDCVMIDHTIADVILVDEESRLPIGRPTLTLAIDIRSRAILAMILRLDAPSALTNGLALHMCATPKDKYIARLDIDAKWTMHGIPRTLSLDNGPDFRSNALKFGCEQNLINLDHRQIANPMMGGIVERVIQTVNRETHQLPGTTKGDIAKRGGYDAEKHACMTLRDLERYLTLFITRQYHERIHKGLGISPRKAWEQGTVSGDEILPAIRTPKDPRRFLIDFLPFKRLGIGRRGFNYRGIHYNDDLLETLRLKDGKRQYVVRRDPRSILRVFAYIDTLDPPRYLEITPVDRTLPDISEEEYYARKEQFKAAAQAGVDQNSVHEAHLEADEIIENAKSLQKGARKKMAKRKNRRKSIKAVPTASPDQIPVPEAELAQNISLDPDTIAGFLDDGFDDVDPL